MELAERPDLNQFSSNSLPRRSALLPAMLTVLCAGTAILWAASRVTSGNYRDLLVAALLGQVVWVVARWRESVYAFMVYVIIEGFLINYFSGFSALNLVKDAFVVALFTVMATILILRHTSPIPKMSWLLPFGAFAVIYLAEVFNPALPTILVGLVGVRVTLLYFLLVPVAYWFFENRARVLQFFVFMVTLSIPVSLFGILQYLKGPQWMLAMSPGFDKAVFYAFGSGVNDEARYFRTFSTFVHTGGFSLYLAFIMLVTLALWGVPAMQPRRMWITFALLIQFLAQLTTGGRTSLILFGIAVVMVLILQRGSLKLAPLLVLFPIVLAGTVGVFGTGFVERYSSVFDVEYVRGRNMPLLTGWIQESMKADWVGLGAGYATVASRHIGITPLNTVVVENGLARMRFEAGLPGAVLYVVFVLSLMLYCLRQAMAVRDIQTRWFSSACATFLIVNLAAVILGNPFDTSPTNVYIWFFAGFLARAPLLDEALTVEKLSEIG